MQHKRVILGCMLAALVLVTAAVQRKDYVAERFDATVSVLSDGSLRVTESVTFRFVGGPFTFVFRELPRRGLSGIDELQAAMEDRLLPPGTGPGFVEIEAGDPLRVTWHFDPLADVRRTFTLSYRVLGALRPQDDAAGLVWRAVPEEHEYRIEAGQVTFEVPPEVTLLTPPRLVGVDLLGSENGEHRVTLRFGEVTPNTAVDLHANFDAGAISPAVAEEPARPGFRPEVVWLALGLAGLGSLAGIAGLVAWWRRVWSDRPAVPPSHARVVAPAPLPPALPATLLGGRSPALGTLFDLARREVIRIEHIPTRWNHRSFSLSMPDSSEPLLAHEEGLLRAVFRQPAGTGELVSLGDAGARLAGNPAAHEGALHQRMLEMGWLDPALEGQRNRMMVVAVLGFLFGTGTVIVGMIAIGAEAWQSLTGIPFVGVALVGLGGAILVSSIAALVLSATLTVLTPEGERQKAAWRGFESYLKGIARGGSTVVQTDLFERYLPFAAAFGMGSGWARHFQKVGGVDVPAWFHGLEASDFGDVTAAIVASSVSVSTSADGGGGASGGGASGAG